MSKEQRFTEKDLLIIGRVIKPHGYRGRLKILSFAESADRYRTFELLYVGESPESLRDYEVLAFLPYKNKAIVEFRGMDYQEAKRCVGESVWVPRSKLPPLEEGEFYWADILGCRVYTEEGSYLGRIESIIQTGSNDVYVCMSDEGQEILIPALNHVIRKIDHIKKVMIIRILEGMI